MKNLRVIYLFSILLFFVSVSLEAQHSILGDDASCYAECKTYNLSGGVGGPYYWQSTGEIKGTNQGSTIEICWNTIGSNTITLVDFSALVATQEQNLEVTVVSIPTPDIIPPKYPTCGRKDSLDNGSGTNEIEPIECLSACPESIAFYSFEENNGAFVDWVVEGGSILSLSPDGVTIQWNLAGTGSIKLIETNGLGCQDSIYYCIDILEPLEVDILAFNGSTNSINICAGQKVYMQAIGSLDATDYEWYMGNGTYNYGANVTASYDQGGTYDVMLIGSSECKCFDTAYYQIIVDSNPGPEITCIGTTCGNEEHTYYAANTCGTYHWNISSNGSITEGGGSGDNFITINWNNGPAGTVGLSTNGCSEAVCTSETVVQIPILDGTATIDGPTVVCKSGYSIYSTQYYHGTDYTWIISGNGYTVGGNGSNEIKVKWQDEPWADENATVSVSYENCYLECGGQASLDVEVKPEFDISFNEIICQNNNAYFNAFEGWNNAKVSWTVTSPTGVVSTYPDVEYFDNMFTEIGIYTVSAIDNAGNYCNNEIKAFFEVIAQLDTPTGIEGPMIICKNEYYNYSITPPCPGISVIWNTWDGSTFKQVRSTSASLQWTSNGPYIIHVIYQIENAFCNSDELIVSLDLAENTTISGSSTSCVDEVETYSFGATNGTQPEWSIIPSDAGSIIQNPDNTIDVMWHIPGNHQITTVYCGANLIFNVDVSALGNNSVIFLDEICPGETTPITSSIPAGSSVVIRDVFDNVVGTTASVLVPNGIYEAEITSINGCIEIIPIVIDTFLPPSVRVSSPDENAFCLPYPNLSIVALDTKDGYTYEWFHNNISMGATTSSISTNVYGGYHVQVTDKNGCTAKSNTHRLYEWCSGDPPPGTCSGGGGSGVLNPDEIYLKCNNLQFTVNGAGISSTSFTWQFDDPDSGVDNFSSETSPIHEFSSAGYFYVFVQGNVPGEDGVDIFSVPAAPRFDYERACAGNDVQFRNHSTFIPGFNIISYTWNFGDPASGVDNNSTDENPTHIYVNPGTYSVTLDIKSNNGCLSTYEVEVLVEEGPFAEFILPTSACDDDGILFEAFQDVDIYEYEWVFDDPTSGVSNTSSSSIAIHTFSSTGSYDVSLSVTDAKNCLQTITKTINVTTSSLSGDITADKIIPICYGEEITLTAPAGGTKYIWSNGSIGQNITVSDPGVYYVTVSENSGCDYVPDPINVIVEGNINTKIRATHLTSAFFGPSYFDSLEICQGELFTLNTSWISGATYEWSNGNTTTYVNENELSGLPPGRHDFYVTITDPTSGCSIESKPMTVIIHPLPDAIQLSSSTPDPCEGEEHTLTIDSPDPNLIYYWSNGGSGYSTTVNKSGYYSVTAKNKNGCERESAKIYIAPLPYANRINIGCLEACFPDTICTPYVLHATSYQWLLNGSPLTGFGGYPNDLVAEQAGDYQLVVENNFGCRDTSDILSIEAEPSDQSVSGIVFIDDNNNGIWDTGEELLAGVPVNLYMGTLLVATIITDTDGYYNFDPVTTSNPHIEIDTTGLGLNLTGGLLQDDVIFFDCIEDKEKNFPLIKACSPTSENLELFACIGGTIIINNIVLQVGDDWTFDDLNATGCDSTTIVNVLAYPESDVILTTYESCQDINSGTLDITIMAGSGLEFAIDNNTTYTTNLQFTGLTPGIHTLWLTDENNCIKNYSFEIVVAQVPQMNTVAQNSCIDGNTGIAEIIPSINGNYLYSLDGITFTGNNIFSNLAVGAYVIYVQEDNLCIYEYPFVIAANPEPQFDLITGESCSIGASGTLEIVPITGGSYTYSLDNFTYTGNLNFDALSVGSYVLYVQELDGCTHVYPFEILPSDPPQIDVVTVNTCKGQNQGSITITPFVNGDYQYSIDGINFSNSTEFSGLGEGTLSIYVLEYGICLFQFPATIIAQPTPDVSFSTEDACAGESNGSLSINTTETGLEYSVDQTNYTSDKIIQDLAAGIHTVYVLSENGCVHPLDVEIFEAEDLEVEFIDPLLDCSVQVAELSPIVIKAQGGISYDWNTGATDSTIMVDNSGQYTVSVSDQCATKEYTWDIQLEDNAIDQPLYFPNIFSPNQDGINECFVPVLNKETTVINYRLIIYDRWGNKYFETTDLDQCWDGTYNGKAVRSGVFVYMLEMDYYYCVEVENLKKYGDVTVVF